MGPAETALGLCRDWNGGDTNPHGNAMPAASRRALAAAAGGEWTIADFCADQLRTWARATTSRSSRGAEAGSSGGGRTATGNGKAAGNGGNGTGNGNGADDGRAGASPHPTPP
jgi:hypothetical protein